MAASISSGPVIQTISPTGPTARITATQVLLDASYPTGGYAISAAQLGLANVGMAIASAGSVQAAANAGVQWLYNIATGKLQGFTATGEIAAATVETNQLVNVIAFGY